MIIPGEERRPSWRQRLVLGLRLIVATGLLAIVAWRLTDWVTLRAVFSSIRPSYLVGCIIIYYLGVWISCVKWRLLLRVQGTLTPIGSLLRWYLAGAFAGSFLPSDIGGDLGRGYLAGRVIADKASLWASIITERLTGLVGMVLLAAVTLALTPALLGWSPIAPLVVLGACTLVGAAGTYLFLRAATPSWMPPSIVSGMERGQELLRIYSRSPGVIGACLSLSLIYHLMTVLSLGLILLALDPGTSGSAAFVSPLVGLVGLLPLSPGGLGVRESVLAVLLGRAGVTGSVALAAALTSRALLWLTALSGLPVLLIELGMLKIPAAERELQVSATPDQKEANRMTMTTVQHRTIPQRDPALWIAIILTGTLTAGLGLARYRGYNSGILDLGSMAQAIFSVLHGQPLITTGSGGNFSRLAGHVELIYYAFAPLLAIWPSPTTLLVAQSALVACGAIPAYRLAMRRLDSRMAARCVALIYLLYPVGLTAVLFDFHGDTLAMPLLLFALDAADRRAWRSFVLWTALALSCKMYMALPIVGIGAYLFLWGGRRRAGMITVATAVIYGALVFFVLRELFRPTGAVTSAASTYTKFYFGSLGDVGTTIGERILNALVVFGPALLMAWRGWRWLLVGAPLALAALISTGPGAGYDFRYHHYAAVVPFVIMAVVDGAERSRRREAGDGGQEAGGGGQEAGGGGQEAGGGGQGAGGRRRGAGGRGQEAGGGGQEAGGGGQEARGRSRSRNWRGDLAFTTLVVGIITALMVDTPLNPTFWLNIPGMGLDPSIYGITSRDALKNRFLAEYVPPIVPIAASMFLGAHLADRNMLYAVRYSDDPGGKRLPSILPKVDAVVADALFDWRTLADETLLGGVDYEAQEIALLLRDPSFALRANRDGLLFFDRGGAGLHQEIVVGTDVTLSPQRADFGPIRMLGAQVTPLGGRRYLAEFAWQLSGNVPTGRLLAISRIDGIPDARIVHLPSYLLLPTNQWQTGQVITERFEVELPTEVAPGSYIWRTAWYNPAHSEAYATDQRSQLSGSSDQEITRIEVRP